MPVNNDGHVDDDPRIQGQSHHVLMKRKFFGGEERIALKFDFDLALINAVKSIPGRMWNGQTKCWHLPFTKHALTSFLKLNVAFDLVDMDDHRLIALGHQARSVQSQYHGTTKGRMHGENSDITSSSDGAQSIIPSPTEVKEMGISSHTEQLKIDWTSKGFAIAMAYSRQHVLFFKSLQGCFWHAGSKLWLAKSSMINLNSIQRKFKCWNQDQFERLTKLINTKHGALTIELFQTPEHARAVIVKVKGSPQATNVLRSVSQRRYDKQRRRWIIPQDQAVIIRLKQYFNEMGAKIIDRLPEHGASYQKDTLSLEQRRHRLLAKFKKSHHIILHDYTDCLIRLRYSWNTVKSYTGAFCKFIEYLHPMPPDRANASSANRYLAKIAAQKVSESLIHQTVNAIKFFYDKVIFIPDFELTKIQRPKQGRYLPTILSMAEVDRMLRSLTNLKHVCILYALYGGGMRLNELLSLKVQDIHWERNQVLVKGGKGKKDRMLMLSQTLKQVLALYFDKYQPVYWLFEGADQKGRYSASSVQAIVRKASRAAGISRRVTTHTLRHCFATHLLDRGTDVRFIQELLGHKDIRTTLVYTHVTTNQVTAIESPLDTISTKTGRNVER